MSKFTEPDKIVFVCLGSKCGKKGGKDIYKAVKSFLKHAGKRDEIEIVKVDCFDRCKYAPVITIQPDNLWAKETSEKEVLRLVSNLTEHPSNE